MPYQKTISKNFQVIACNFLGRPNNIQVIVDVFGEISESLIIFLNEQQF